MSHDTLVKVALADDHALVRAGLKQIINKEEDVQVMVDVANGQQLLDQLAQQKVDVILLDLEMPVMDGKAALKRLKTDFEHIKVIILTVHEHDSFIVDMMESGAHGYLLKDSEPEEVIKAIKTVHQEGHYFNAKVSKALLGGLSSRNGKYDLGMGEALNQRELDVLSLICQEKTTTEIADVLFLSPKTIEGYRKSLLEKTGCKNAVGLAIYATRNGLV